MNKPIEIAIDFDGTVTTHSYPKVGMDIGAVPVLKEIAQNGHKLILNTVRGGKELQDAVDWFKQNDIPLYGVNKNPTQHEWTDSPKVYAQIYIDDAALGCPLTVNQTFHPRPYVNWEAVAVMLEDKGLI